MLPFDSPPDGRLTLPRSVGRYELLNSLGSGGMGTVFRARQAQLDKMVAVKILDARVASRPGGVTRFLREARAAAQIRHPHVIEVFDVGIDDGVAFIAMELLEGVDLSSLLRDRKRLPLHKALDILMPVIAGVRAAHEAGVVHRDLKPSNLFLARRGRTLVHPIILDFGVSRLLDEDERGVTPVTGSEAMIGTAAYVAPEQAMHGRLADDRSDQYSLGVIVYECVTGVRPFEGQSVYQLLQSIATAEIRPPSQVNPSLPPTLDEVLLRALERDPEARYANVESFAAALLDFAAPRTWQLWGRELLGSAAGSNFDAVSATAVPSDHDPDDARAILAPRPETLWAHARAGLLVGFVAGALVTGSAAWGWSRWRITDEAPLISRAVAGPGPSALTEIRPLAAVSALRPAAAAEQAPLESPIVELGLKASAVPRSLPAKPALANPAPTKVVQTRPRTEERRTAPTRGVEFGVNDAPILE
ncbi:MAG TPA: serine/threonine-protein kinase [Polyangiaceae bacterium]|nr:serine/threonine-protein kinase [Polyangiaceae bacterium]